MSTPDILPDSRLKDAGSAKGLLNRGAKGMWRPVFCANCGKDQGYVPDDPKAIREAFMLCDDCYEKHGVPAGLMASRDQLFIEKSREAQLEHYGHVLTPQEVAVELGDPESLMSKLAREFQHLTPSP